MFSGGAMSGQAILRGAPTPVCGACCFVPPTVRQQARRSWVARARMRRCVHGSGDLLRRPRRPVTCSSHQGDGG